jgi:hypothetical protein
MSWQHWPAVRQQVSSKLGSRGSLQFAGRSFVSLHVPHVPSGLQACFPQLHATGVSHQRTAPGMQVQFAGGGGGAAVPASAPVTPVAHVVTSPVHAPHWENSPCFWHVWAPSWHPFPLRRVGSTVQHARVVPSPLHPQLWRSPALVSEQFVPAGVPPPFPLKVPDVPELAPAPLLPLLLLPLLPGFSKPDVEGEPPHATTTATNEAADNVTAVIFMTNTRSNTRAAWIGPFCRRLVGLDACDCLPR